MKISLKINDILMTCTVKSLDTGSKHFNINLNVCMKKKIYIIILLKSSL